MNTNLLNQTTKNKATKNINFNPAAIIASVPMISNTLNNNYIIPNTTKNNINPKTNNNIIKHRKCDSYRGLRLPK